MDKKREPDFEVDFPADADIHLVMKISLDELERLIISMKANTQLLLGEYELSEQDIEDIYRQLRISLLNAQKIIKADKDYLSKD